MKQDENVDRLAYEDDPADDVLHHHPPGRRIVLHRGAYTEMLVSSIIGLIASLVLSADAVVLAANPNADLACNVTSKISGGTVGTSWQASLLGLPNAFLGLMA